MDLSAKIEAILFFKSEPVNISWLAKLFGKSEGEVKDALGQLEQVLAGRGVILILKEDEVRLGTSPEMGAIIEALVKEELAKDLGKAALETLAIVLYRGPVTRSQIDYIRGVNSTFILRHLLVRGLVERVPNPKDARSYLYKPTFDLLSFMGISTREDLPQYTEVVDGLKVFEASVEETKEDNPDE